MSEGKSLPLGANAKSLTLLQKDIIAKVMDTGRIEDYGQFCNPSKVEAITVSRCDEGGFPRVAVEVMEVTEFWT